MYILQRLALVLFISAAPASAFANLPGEVKLSLERYQQLVDQAAKASAPA